MTRNINMMNITFDKKVRDAFLRRENDYAEKSHSTTHSDFMSRLLQLMQDHMAFVNARKKLKWYQDALEKTKNEYNELKEKNSQIKKIMEN